MVSKVAVIYYSSTGNTHQMAEAVAAGAKEAGAEVRMRKVEELAPDAAIAQNPAWKAHHEATKELSKASLDDLEWADAIIFGTPLRCDVRTAKAIHRPDRWALVRRQIGQ